MKPDPFGETTKCYESQETMVSGNGRRAVALLVGGAISSTNGSSELRWGIVNPQFPIDAVILDMAKRTTWKALVLLNPFCSSRRK